MKAIFTRHKSFWFEAPLLLSAVVGFGYLLLSLWVSYYANIYTVIHAGNAATDILLDHLPTLDVEFIFADGALLFIVIIAVLLLYEPKRIPFTLKSIAIFMLTRSAFVILTHLGAPLHGLYIDSERLVYRLSSGDDLFFSAHTGLPFLLAFIFWDEKYLRYFFFASTAIGAAAVILGHLHYSIDVFSALFISFGIFHITKNVFASDFELLRSPSSPRLAAVIVANANDPEALS